MKKNKIVPAGTNEEEDQFNKSLENITYIECENDESEDLVNKNTSTENNQEKKNGKNFNS